MIRKTCFSSFLTSFVQPSLTAVSAAAVTLLIVLAAYCVIFTPAFMASSYYRYLLSDDQDSMTLITHRAFAAASASLPAILYFGDSDAIRCVETEKAQEDLIAGFTGRKFAFHDLATSAQSTWVMASLAQQVPPGPGGVLVIGITPDILGIGSRDDSRISLQGILKWPMVGVDTPVLADEAQRAGLSVPWKTGIYAIDQVNFILSRRKAIARNLLMGPPQYGDPLNAPWYAYVGTPEFHAEEHRLLPEVASLYDKSTSENLAVLERMIQRARDQGPTHVVILMAPMHPGWNDDPFGRAFFARYRADLEAFARKVGGTFASATYFANLQKTDFVDFEGHINNPEARHRCAVGLARVISDIVGRTP